jgi:hypothetical protein
MHTEFVRDMILAPNTLATTEPGTGHWDYQTSIFMAGMGVQGGKIVGDFKRGPNSAVYTDVNFPQAIYRSLPIDTSATGGQPTSSGEIVTSRSIFPTMLSIFGASGLNPITGGGANAIAAVMKSTGF